MEPKDVSGEGLRYSVMFGGEGFLNFWGCDDFAKRPGWKPITAEFLQTVRGIKTEESVRMAAEAGFNAVWTDFSMGRGPRAEKSSREEAGRFVKICHEHGIQVFLYVQAANVFWQDFFKEIPEAVDWLARDPDGRPVTYLDGAYWFRYYTCINNPGWIEYTKGVIREALVDRGADGIHLDNIETLPRICHCPLCLRKFQEHLQRGRGERRPDPRRETAYDGLVHPPREISRDWRAPMDATDPLVREWVRFRSRCVATFLAELKVHIRRLNPKALLTSNTSNLATVNKLLAHAVDFQELGASQDLLFIETDTVFPRMEMHLGKPHIVTNARAYKWGASLTGGKPVVVSLHLAPREGRVEGLGGLISVGHSPAQARLVMAEGMANGGYGSCPLSHEGQILTTAEASPCREAVKRYNHFLIQQRELFQGARSWANVSVFNSQASLAWSFKQAAGAAIGVEQTLIQCHIPFDIVTDRDISSSLDRYQLLVLPNTACMSDEQIEAIRRFVQEGGNLIATGKSSLYDEDFNLRGDYGLRDLFGLSYTESGPERTQKEYGRGKVVFFPRASCDGGTADWPRLPEDWKRLADTIQSLVSLPVILEAPPWVYINLLSNGDDTKRSIHLVNYAGDWNERIDRVRLELALPDGKQLSRALLLSPDREGSGEALAFSQGNGRASFDIRGLGVYDIVVLEVAG